MKTTILLAALTVVQSSAWLPETPEVNQIETAAICFKTGERQSGMNKICYYDCLGSEAAITVSSAELCPLSINR